MTTPAPPAAPLAPFAAFADFGKMVPGFDFLQSLAQQAGAAPAAANPWIAPTLNVQDLERRIQELKTVQFWLDQNATALRATIQAMEVQKMTLAALGSMNVGFGEMVHALQPKPAAPAKSAGKSGGKAKPAAKVFAGLEIPPRRAATAPEPALPPASVSTAAAVNPTLVDPMQWWGALAQQFQAIAADAAKNAPPPPPPPPPTDAAGPASLPV